MTSAEHARAAPSADVFDVVVLGADLIGAWLAHRVVARGGTVALIDDRDIAERGRWRRVVIDPGIEGVLAPSASLALRRALAMLEGHAPHLCFRAPFVVPMASRWARARAIAALEAHDAAGPFAHVGARDAAIGAEGPGLSLEAHVLLETRMQLALLCAASARGADVRIGASIEAVRAEDPSPTVVLRDGSITARRLIVTAPALAERWLGHRGPTRPVLEAILSPPPALPARTEQDASVTHLPERDRSYLSRQSPEGSVSAHVAALLERAGIGDAAPEILDHHTIVLSHGLTRAVSRSPSLTVIEGGELGSAHAVIDALARDIAGGAPGVGDDARLEEPTIELTPAIERIQLGADVLASLMRRHGERAGAIAEAVASVPRRGAIVCPCHAVIDAEIRHALDAELASDLEAIARRTELGTGPCRGVRCARRAAAIVAEHTLLQAPASTIAEAFLRARRSACVLAPGRDAALDELETGITVACGRPEERAPA